MKLIITIWKYRINLSISIYKKRDEWTRGILNRTQDGKYVFFIDYDMMKPQYIEGELRHLQQIHKLGNIHLFQSSQKGFHAISFTKLTAQQYIKILQETSCDTAFKNLPRFTTYRNWVLRNFGKGKTERPKYVTTLQAQTKKQQSSAHHKYITTLYPEIKEKLNNPDQHTKIDIIDYATGGNT